MTAQRPDPVVALDLRPRLLRDVVERALTADAVQVMDTAEIPEHCDVLVTTRHDVPPGVADLVVFVDAESSPTDSIPALLARIGSWMPSGTDPDHR